MYKDPNVLIENDCDVVDCTFGVYTKVGHHSVCENVIMQDYSYCEPFCIIQNTVISKYCDIARNVRIGATQHPLYRPTTHHMTYRRKLYAVDVNDDQQFFQNRYNKLTVLDPDVWIGHGAVIQAGVHVGVGAVIGSNAVVTKDVPPYAIVVGVPAKVIRYRFDEEIREKLLEIAWWDWPDDVMRDRFQDFCGDITSFIKKYGGKKKC